MTWHVMKLVGKNAAAINNSSHNLQYNSSMFAIWYGKVDHLTRLCFRVFHGLVGGMISDPVPMQHLFFLFFSPTFRSVCVCMCMYICVIAETVTKKPELIVKKTKVQQT